MIRNYHRPWSPAISLYETKSRVDKLSEEQEQERSVNKKRGNRMRDEEMFRKAKQRVLKISILILDAARRIFKTFGCQNRQSVEA